MALPVSCCPDGYIYVSSDGTYLDPSSGITPIVNNSGSTPTYDQVIGKCAQFENHGFAQNPVSTIPCNCCPKGYAIVSKDGYVVTPTGAVVLINKALARQCVNLSDFSQTADGSACPCCPDGYVYFPALAKCFLETKVSGAITTVPTIPCVICDTCITPPPPPPCPDCGNTALPITFVLDVAGKVCVDCPTQDELQIHDKKLIAFMPNLLIDPLINFILRL